MIILRDITFPQMARFLHDNVLGLHERTLEQTQEQTQEQALEQAPDQIVDPALRAGLADLLALLRSLYADVAAYDTGDTAKDYAALVNAVRFLYGCATVGALRETAGRSELVAPKPALSKAYKKGNVSGCIAHLARHGLATAYSRDGKACDALGRATALILTSERDPGLIPALVHFAALNQATYARLKAAGTKGLICDAMATFLKGDYASAAGQRPLQRATLDPLRPDIIRTVGRYADAWRTLVAAMTGETGWGASGFMHYGHSPAWSVSFSQGRQRPTAIYTLGSQVVFIEFTLPMVAAQAIILARSGFADTVRLKIEGLHCVKCPKQCRGENLTKIDGVWLCSGRAEARRIYMTLSEPDEFASILTMIQMASRVTA